MYIEGVCYSCGGDILSKVSVSEDLKPIADYIARDNELRAKNGFSLLPLSVDDVQEYVICDSCNGLVDVIEKYKDEYTISAQERVEGVIVDPVQRYFFDNVNNAHRPQQEHDEWFCIPYIVSNNNVDTDKIYDVRCYDGGAWDRSTGKAWNLSFEDAINFVKTNYENY